mgnify:CR=1 FL=1
MLDEMMPFPTPLITPPVTRIYFISFLNNYSVNTSSLFVFPTSDCRIDSHSEPSQLHLAFRNRQLQCPLRSLYLSGLYSETRAISSSGKFKMEFAKIRKCSQRMTILNLNGEKTSVRSNAKWKEKREGEETEKRRKLENGREPQLGRTKFYRKVHEE